MARKDNQMSLFGATEGEIAMTARGFTFVSRGLGASIWGRGCMTVYIDAAGGVKAFEEYGEIQVAAWLEGEDLRACLTVLDEVSAALAS